MEGATRSRKDRLVRAAGGAALAVLGLVLAVGAVPAQGRRQHLVAIQTVALVATDDAVTAKKSVAVLTDRNTFAQLVVPAAAPILRGGKRLPLARIKTGTQLA